MDAKQSKRALIALSLVAALAVLLYLRWGNPLDPFDDRWFSSARWQRASDEIRARMARSAVRQITPHLSQAAVTTILGKPDNVLTDREDAGGNHLPGVETYEYSLGCWSSYGFDQAHLYVHFDETGRVIGCEISGY